MDATQYQEQVINTESPVTDDMRQRMRQMTRLVLLYLDFMINIGKRMDRIKKYVYYGKSCQEIEIAIIRENDPGSAPMNVEMQDRAAREVRRLHGLIGLITETGELSEAFNDCIRRGAELDAVNVMEEIGDIEWYAAQECAACGYVLSDALEANLRKLAKRYGQDFSQKNAIDRDVTAEREILESAQRRLFTENDDVA